MRSSEQINASHHSHSVTIPVRNHMHAQLIWLFIAMRFASVTFQQVSISLSAAEEATGEQTAFPRWSQAAELFTSRPATHCRRSAQQCTTEIIVERESVCEILNEIGCETRARSVC